MEAMTTSAVEDATSNQPLKDPDGRQPLEDASEAELSIYYQRRFQRFAEELGDHVQKIQEYKEQHDKYRAALQEADVQRKAVEALQARLSEVEFQMEKDRMRLESIVRQNQDMELADMEQQEQVQKLLAAAPPQQGLPTPPGTKQEDLERPLEPPPGQEPIPDDGQVGSSTAGLSKSVVRSIRVPRTGEDAIEARKKDLRRQLEEEIEAHHALLRDFAKEREHSMMQTEVETEAIRVDIRTAITGLKEDTDHFGDLIETYAQAHFQNMALQRRYAEEVQTLKVCNQELMRNAQGTLSTVDKDATLLERRILREADQHVRHTRHLEAKDRRDAHATYASLEEVEGRTDTKMTELRKGIAVLKERCAKHRKVRQFALEGIRSDLSLLKQKLKVLEEVAKQVDVQVDFHIQTPSLYRFDSGQIRRTQTRGRGPAQGKSSGHRNSQQRRRTPGAPYKTPVA